jgi:hypothetical protein
MCTAISHTTSITGAGKGPGDWFPVTQVSVAYDHPAHSPAEHAVLVDFSNYTIGPEARVAVEMDLDSARALFEQLRSTIAATEAAGLAD